MLKKQAIFQAKFVTYSFSNWIKIVKSRYYNNRFNLIFWKIQILGANSIFAQPTFYTSKTFVGSSPTQGTFFLS